MGFWRLGAVSSHAEWPPYVLWYWNNRSAWREYSIYGTKDRALAQIKEIDPVLWYLEKRTGKSFQFEELAG
jgi:hypothetical protein